MSSAGRWSDLLTRIVSALALLAMALGAALMGPLGFAIFVALVCGCMTWELVRMHEPRSEKFSLVAGIVAGLTLMGGMVLTSGGIVLSLGLFAIIAIALSLLVTREQAFCGLYLFAVLIASLVLAGLYSSGLVILLLLLLGVVIATDVAGYFAGRLIGGPKFWPSVSPKKTWSGVLAGWIAAVLIGFLLGQAVGASTTFALMALAMSIGSQFGDIVESAMKRRAGVKDSSELIPGHGGFLDRFDGVLGASLVVIPFLGWS